LRARASPALAATTAHGCSPSASSTVLELGCAPRSSHLGGYLGGRGLVGARLPLRKRSPRLRRPCACARRGTWAPGASSGPPSAPTTALVAAPACAPSREGSPPPHASARPVTRASLARSHVRRAAMGTATAFSSAACCGEMTSPSEARRRAATRAACAHRAGAAERVQRSRRPPSSVSLKAHAEAVRMRWVRSHLWPYRYYKKLFPRGARRRRGAYHLDPPTHTHDRATTPGPTEPVEPNLLACLFRVPLVCPDSPRCERSTSTVKKESHAGASYRHGRAQ
jgi:hypothetical protein